MSARHRAVRQVTGRARWSWHDWPDIRNGPALLVLVVAGLGLAYVAVAPRHWLRGVLLLALAMAVAGMLRATLPASRAGLLAVRTRFLDVVWYAGVSGAMLVLGLWLRASGRT